MAEKEKEGDKRPEEVTQESPSLPEAEGEGPIESGSELVDARAPDDDSSVESSGHHESVYEVVCAERDRLRGDLDTLQVKERSMAEVNNELERKLLVGQDRVEELNHELDTTHQKLTHLETQLEEVTSVSADIGRERDEVIGKLTLLERERWKLINDLTTAEHKLMEATKESEKLGSVAKKQKSELTRLQGSLNKSDKSCSELTREVSRLRGEVSSLGIKFKWAQNKLKTETDGHKDAKAALAASTKKLKESREEGEQIRADLKRMIHQYQESEEMRSNSLGLKLQKTQQELKAHEQEIADQQELHELTVKELDLTKASYKISQQEVSQYKAKVVELTGRSSAQTGELEDLKRAVEKMKCEQNKLSSEKTELEGVSQTLESERSKFTALREAFTSMQKSCQHLEREVGRRGEREAQLLTFSEKLSSSNAELTAERSDNEAKVLSLRSECSVLSTELAAAREREEGLQERLLALTETSQLEMERLVQQLDNKSKAVEELSLSLEDERELVKAARKKNTSNIRDLQRQLQQSKRRVDQLEASLAAEREAPATLPVTDGSRASSQNSLNELVPHNNNNTAVATLTAHTSDEERGATSPSPELLFQTMDSEKLLLVERLCRHKKELARLEEKIEFFEEHISQLTDDIQRKSKIVQSFILREESGTLAPASYDEHKARHVKKGGVMATVFTGGKGKGQRDTEMTYELSLEINRKMQSILEDTLLKNITLKESIDTLGREIQRLSGQLQAYEAHTR